MKKKERESIVLEKLMREKKVELDEMISLLGVSDSTVRRIFCDIEKTGRAVRTHGGLALITNKPGDYSFEALARTQSEQKIAIGKAACALVEPNDNLYLDCGTTLLSFCVQLSERFASNGYGNLQIFTNSLANLEILAPHTSVNLLGGRYRQNRKDFAGYMTENMLQHLHFTKCFLGADAANLKEGMMATDFETAALNHIVANNSEKVIYLCDSTKLRRTSLISYAPLSQGATLVTDRNVEEETANALRESGVTLILA